MNEDQVAAAISEMCFAENMDTDRRTLHKSLLTHLKDLLLGFDFDVHTEESQKFYTLKIKTGRYYSRRGYIDLVAKNNNTRIGVEFDSGISLKNKSIEKLMQSPCKMCLGIVRGNDSDYASRVENISRIHTNERKWGFNNRTFWLIVLHKKHIEKII